MSPNNVLFSNQYKERFRGFLPVVVDVETAGIDPQKNALLEMCMVLVDMDEQGSFRTKTAISNIFCPLKARIWIKNHLNLIKLIPFQPLRFAVDEKHSSRTII